MSTAPSEVLMPTEKKKKVKKPVEAKGAVVKDELVELAHDVETMDKEQAFSAIHPLLETVNSSYIRIGGVLAVIRDNEWWAGDGYASFRDLLEKAFGLKYRKAMYWVQIYEDLINSGVAWERVKSLGWCKLKEVSPVLTTDNCAEWVAKAEGLTVLQLHEVVRLAQMQAVKNNSNGASPSDVSPEGVETTTTTMSFKVHTDQKETIRLALDKAKQEGGTEFDAVALEGICLNYLAGGKVTKKVKAKTLNELFAQQTPEDVLKAFGEVWPDIDVEVAL